MIQNEFYLINSIPNNSKPMSQNQVQILIPASMSKLWTTSCCVLCDHKGGGCLCAGAGAGINKAPTFGVLNRIKMCVAALLSTVTQQLPGWKSVCCPVRENISFRPENIWLLLSSSAVWTSAWTQEASSRLVWVVPIIAILPLSIDPPLALETLQKTSYIQHQQWSLVCAVCMDVSTL